MTRVLLTTVFRPFGVENKYNKKGDETLLDYLASRLTREPGLFTLSSYVPHSSLHLIAANLPAETRVLEYPSEQEYVAELKKGWDYVGITFVIKGFGKAAKMISLARKHAPHAKIVLGGFGTALHNVEELGADALCKGEGVAFMRHLLGAPQELPIRHPRVTADITLKIFQDYGFLEKERIGLITSGFGCPNACEFCCTSAYYQHRNLRFLQTGRDIYDAMRVMDDLQNFLLFEEDFALYKDKVTELGDCIRAESTASRSYACFASCRSLSEYDFEELVSGGCGHIWIGIESVAAPFEKRYGRERDIRDVFAQLRSLGVTTTGSTIFGLDHQTPEQLPSEVDFVVELSPTTVQLSNLMPAEGTRLRERLEEAHRIKVVGYLDADLYSEVVEHPNFQPGQIRTAIFDGYQRLYDTLGPSIYRFFDTWFTGYKNLRHSPNAALRSRADLYAQRIRRLLPLFLETSPFLPNDDIRYRVRNTVAEVIGELGEPTLEQRGRGELMARIFALEEVKRRQLEDMAIEPKLMTRDYAPVFAPSALEVVA
jgi:Fe-S oxidoreductase